MAHEPREFVFMMRAEFTPPPQRERPDKEPREKTVREPRRPKPVAAPLSLSSAGPAEKKREDFIRSSLWGIGVSGVGILSLGVAAAPAEVGFVAAAAVFGAAFAIPAFLTGVAALALYLAGEIDEQQAERFQLPGDPAKLNAYVGYMSLGDDPAAALAKATNYSDFFRITGGLKNVPFEKNKIEFFMDAVSKVDALSAASDLKERRDAIRFSELPAIGLQELQTAAGCRSPS